MNYEWKSKIVSACCLILKNENLDNGREEMYLHNWEDIAASNSMEMRKPESFLGFQYPIG